jgi:RNA polymerase sigma factor for flagellar operon FliA
MIGEHIGLVYKVAHDLHRLNPGSDFDALVDLGLKGLEKAMARFDPARGFKFSTYSVPVIRGAMLNGIARSGDREVRKDRKTIATVTKDLANFLGP